MSYVDMADVNQLLARIQNPAMDRGYYLALAGGVLNRGNSTNDIDLVAVPIDGNSTKEALISYLSKAMVLLRDPTLSSRGRNIDLYHFAWHHTAKIDLAVINTVSVQPISLHDLAETITPMYILESDSDMQSRLDLGIWEEVTSEQAAEIGKLAGGIYDVHVSISAKGNDVIKVYATHTKVLALYLDYKIAQGETANGK